MTIILPTSPPQPTTLACSVEECDRRRYAFGFCRMHYRRFKKHGDPLTVLTHSPRLSLIIAADVKFWQHVNVGADDDCWNWRSPFGRKGYGLLRINDSRRVYAHRYSAKLHFGMFDERLLVCHHCDNPKCVNPRHLYLGTALDNVRDMYARRRHPNATRTHCVNGHEFTPENTARRGPGKHRRCLTCERANGRAYRARIKAASQPATTLEDE